MCTMETLTLVLTVQARKPKLGLASQPTGGLSHRVTSNRTGTRARLCRLPGNRASCLSPVPPLPPARAPCLRYGVTPKPCLLPLRPPGQPSYTLGSPSLLSFKFEKKVIRRWLHFIFLCFDKANLFIPPGRSQLLHRRW